MGRPSASSALAVIVIGVLLVGGILGLEGVLALPNGGPPNIVALATNSVSTDGATFPASQGPTVPILQPQQSVGGVTFTPASPSTLTVTSSSEPDPTAGQTGSTPGRTQGGTTPGPTTGTPSPPTSPPPPCPPSPPTSHPTPFPTFPPPFQPTPFPTFPPTFQPTPFPTFPPPFQPTLFPRYTLTCRTT